MKVIITSDSTTDLSPELRERFGIRLLPLQVTLGGQTFTDGVDITPEDIYVNYEKNKQLPKTAAPNLAACTEFFQQCRAEGAEVVHFTISSEMSSSCSNAKLAAEDIGGIEVVDTRNLSTGGGLLVIRAAEMAQQGASAQEIAQACRALTEKVDASFVIDNLEFLHKGGRCSALAMFGANMLQLKPCIVVKDGKMEVASKYRGKFDRILPKYITDRLGDGSGLETRHVFVTHAGCDEAVVKACVEQVKSLGVFEEVHVTRAGCTVSAHCGRNTLGVLFLRK